MYCGVAVLGPTGFDFSLLSPTMETAPGDLEMSSLVQTFLDFLASVEGVEFCGCEAGGCAFGSVVCATAERAAKTSTRTGSKSGRSTDPPVFQSQGPFASSLRGSASGIGGGRVRLVQVATSQFFSNGLDGFL